MPLFDQSDLDELNAPAHVDRACAFRAMMESLSEDDANQIREVLKDSSVTDVRLAKKLKEKGFQDVSRNMLGRHRLGECKGCTARGII